MLKSQTMREVGRGNREMSGAVRNVMPLHPSLLSCNRGVREREELYGKLLRADGAARRRRGGGPEIQINGLGRGRLTGKTAFC